MNILCTAVRNKREQRKHNGGHSLEILACEKKSALLGERNEGKLISFLLFV